MQANIILTTSSSIITTTYDAIPKEHQIPIPENMIHLNGIDWYIPMEKVA